MANDIGPLNLTTLKLSETNAVNILRESPRSVFFEFKEASNIRSNRKSGELTSDSNQPSYSGQGFQNEKTRSSKLGSQ
ncbi:hypothetical protein PR048_013273 [Dryococelus australis]|uniref:Uncharacterized protein n=1 Tax=Dryococelus australis TaxID=614101 RepID=A0ABQ9HRP3_9NEOP|nr:hypothetical protein PR048_013273 [Dryococelus australis]